MYLQIVQMHEILKFLYLQKYFPYSNEIICLKNTLTSIDLDPQERHQPPCSQSKKIRPSAYINIDNTFMWYSGWFMCSWDSYLQGSNFYIFTEIVCLTHPHKYKFIGVNQKQTRISVQFCHYDCFYNKFCHTSRLQQWVTQTTKTKHNKQ